MKIYDESISWLRNENWFRINREKDYFEIRDDAPERAKRSFVMWCRNNAQENTTEMQMRIHQNCLNCVKQNLFFGIYISTKRKEHRKVN